MFTAKPKSDKWRQKVSGRMKRAYADGKLSMQGQNNPMFGRKRPDVSKWHEDPDFTKKRFQNMGMKPNKKERKLDEIFKRHNLEFRYVGDGKISIGRKCPDFIHLEQRKIVELFGNYWHQPSDVDKKITYFASKGFATLIIWENELECESHVVEKVKAFMKQPQELSTPSGSGKNALRQPGHIRNGADGGSPGGVRSEPSTGVLHVLP
jgi:very-short-patch-repair endonuclease